MKLAPANLAPPEPADTEAHGLSSSEERTKACQQEATAIHAVPAQWLERGFRLLILREFRNKAEPPGFAWIDQQVLRQPQRLSRHGLFFAVTLRPEIMAWLGENLGPPSIRGESGPPRRNLLWPVSSWHREDRSWAGGIRTAEWFADIVFPEEASWRLFQRQWLDRLMCKDDSAKV
jgi:hypothetical protein